jgi:hypothetical protein
MDSPRDDMQSLPEGIEALRALVLTTMSERDAAVTEREVLIRCGGRLAGREPTEAASRGVFRRRTVTPYRLPKVTLPHRRFHAPFQ